MAMVKRKVIDPVRSAAAQARWARWRAEKVKALAKSKTGVSAKLMLAVGRDWVRAKKAASMKKGMKVGMKKVGRTAMKKKGISIFPSFI